MTDPAAIQQAMIQAQNSLEQAVAASIASLTVEQAAAVINAALTQDPPMAEKMPEGDGDKIADAGHLLTLCVSAGKAIIQVGRKNVPMHPAIEAVLSEVGVALPAEADALPPQPVATAAPPAAPVAQPAQQPVEAPAPVAQPAPAVQPEPAAQAVPAAPGPGLPAKGETWVDSQGHQWVIEQYNGGPQVQAHSAQSGEPTIVPVTFLVERTAGAIPEAAASAPVPQPQQEVAPAPAAPPAPVAAPPAPVAQPAAPVAVAPAQPEPPTPSGLDEFVPPEQLAQEATDQQQSTPEDRQVVEVEHDDEGDDEYANLMAEVIKLYQPAGQPVLYELTTAPDELPDDLTSIQDNPARRLHSQRHSLFSRARTLHAMEQAIARRCDSAYRIEIRGPRRAARGELPSSATAAEVIDLAEEKSERAGTWRRRREFHEEQAAAWELQMRLRAADVDVLSRDWTMRGHEERHA